MWKNVIQGYAVYRENNQWTNMTYGVCEFVVTCGKDCDKEKYCRWTEHRPPCVSPVSGLIQQADRDATWRCVSCIPATELH